MKNNLKIRLTERLKIYRASPQVTATYSDLEQIMDILLEIIENEKVVEGFKDENKTKDNQGYGSNKK